MVLVATRANRIPHFQKIFLFALLVTVFALLSWGRSRHFVVAFVVLLASVVVGVVPEDSKAVGVALGDLDDMAEENDAVILGLIRNDRRIDRAGRRETVRADDILIVEADPDSLDWALRALGLQPASRAADEDGKAAPAKLVLAEAVVQPDARIAGQTAASLRLRRRCDVSLLAVSRQGHPFRGRLRSFRFRPGDILLLEGAADDLPEAIVRLGCLPLAERQLRIGQPRRAGLAIALFAAMILCATLGVLSLPVALAVAAASMVVLDQLRNGQS